MTKKFRLAIGTLATITSVAPVIACTTSITDDDAKIQSQLTTQEAMYKLENEWLYNVVAHQYAEEFGLDSIVSDEWENVKSGEFLVQQDIFAAAFKHYTEFKVNESTEFLQSIAGILLKDPSYIGEEGDAPQKREDLSLYGINSGGYVINTWFGWLSERVAGADDTVDGEETFVRDFNGDLMPHGVTATDDENIAAIEQAEKNAMLIIMEDGMDKTGVRTEVLRYLIVHSYLSLSKEDWSSIDEDYDPSEDSSINKLIQEDENYPMLRHAIDTKGFLRWRVELDASNSMPYIEEEEIPYNVAIEHLLRDGDAEDPRLVDTDIENTTPITSTEYTDNVGNPNIVAANRNIGYLTANKRISTVNLPDLDKGTEYGIEELEMFDSLLGGFSGYAGLGAEGSRGTGKLRFTNTDLKKAANNPDYWIGLVYEDDIVRKYDLDEDGEYIDKNEFGGFYEEYNIMKEDTSQVEIEYLFGMMPLFRNADPAAVEDAQEGQIDVTDDAVYTWTGSLWEDNLDTVSFNLFMHNGNLFTEARDWFINEDNPIENQNAATDKTNGFRLYIENEWARNTYLSMGIAYIEED